MPDLPTRYLGLELENPLVASASPLAGQLDSIRALEDAGAGADRPALAVRGADRTREDGRLELPDRRRRRQLPRGVLLLPRD